MTTREDEGFGHRPSSGQAVLAIPEPGPDPAPQAQGWRNFVVLGDSLGAGVGDPVPSLQPLGWADRLARALTLLQPSLRYTNLAIKGLKTGEIAATQLAQAQALGPDLIAVVAGANDVRARAWDAGRFRAEYEALLAPLVATGATVITTTWHNLTLRVPMPTILAAQLAERFAAAVAAVGDLSRRYGTLFVDFWSMPAALDAGCYSADGAHPNVLGYLRIAEVVAFALERHSGLPIPRSALTLPWESRPVPVRAASRAVDDPSIAPAFWQPGLPPGHPR